MVAKNGRVVRKRLDDGLLAKEIGRVEAERHASAQVHPTGGQEEIGDGLPVQVQLANVEPHVLVRWEREILFGPQVAVDRPDELESGCQVQPALTVEEEVLGPLRRSGGWGWEGRAPQRGDRRGALQRVVHSDADIPRA